MYNFLRKIPLFADLPEADLAQLCEMVTELRLPAGTQLFAEGDVGDQAYVIKEGEVEVTKFSAGRAILLAVRTVGDVIGEIALLEETPRTATVRARSDALLLAIRHEQLEQLLNTSPSAARAMLHTVLGRWRTMAALVRQSEKMAQLGTLTAGVAHELNNPAAAVKRGADQLTGTLTAFGEARSRLDREQWTAAQETAVADLTRQAQETAVHPLRLDPVLRSDREYSVESWLEAQSIPDAWLLASPLVDLGYEPAALDQLAGQFDAHVLPPLLNWLAANYTLYNLLAEINQGATRISDIVRALKSYAYLDQAPVQSVDIHEGLDNTLLVLRSKLRGVSVRQEYDPNLPRIEGYGSELNQVWTNLLDNAADALAEQPDGEIIIRTGHEPGWVTVEIQDNGPGIPAEIQPRIFEAFFTTKPPGKGTGLGLDISYSIVVNKHRGDIRLFSRPGLTCFQVKLPLNFAAADSGDPLMPAGWRPSDSILKSILSRAKTIAVVGISARPERVAYQVPAYMRSRGYRIIPVTPTLTTWEGETAFPDLPSIGEPIDIVLIFRRSEDVPPHVEEAIAAGARVVWMQEGIVNEMAAQLAQRAGLQVVMDTCIRSTHRRLFREDAR